MFVTVPTAPRSLIVDDVTDTTVTLSWMPPDPPNGIITQYEVQRKRSDRNNYNNNNNQRTTNLALTVTGLNRGTEYDFRVRAFTVVGQGSNSNVVTVFVGKFSKYIQNTRIIKNYKFKW